MNRKQIVLLSAVLIAVLSAWTIGTYYIAYHQGMSNNTPKRAVEHFIRAHKKQGLEHAILAPGKAAIGNGYVMVTETLTAYNQFEVLYVQPKDGRWQAQLVTKIHDKNIQGSSPKPVFKELGLVPSTRTKIGYAVILTSGSNIASVMGYKTFTKSGGKVPFSFVRVGSLPIWIYKFSRMTDNVNGAKAYNKAGNVIASMSP